jgi:hypothetical protein
MPMGLAVVLLRYSAWIAFGAYRFGEAASLVFPQCYFCHNNFTKNAFYKKINSNLNPATSVIYQINGDESWFKLI